MEKFNAALLKFSQSLSAGMQRIVNSLQTPRRDYQRFARPYSDDAKMMRQDWKAVGGDLTSAQNQYLRQYTRRRSPREHR